LATFLEKRRVPSKNIDDFPLIDLYMGGSSIAKKSFARPRHFGVFSIFVAENQKLAFSGI